MMMKVYDFNLFFSDETENPMTELQVKTFPVHVKANSYAEAERLVQEFSERLTCTGAGYPADTRQAASNIPKIEGNSGQTKSVDRG